MKRTLIAAAAIVLVGGNAFAASDFVDTAQVISATPIIERVSEPRQECDAAPAPQKNNSIVAPILGGIVGGLLGHQVGGGRGNTAATIAGAAGGAMAGSAIGNRAATPGAPVCRTVQSMREVINGYDVVYRYNGRDVRVAMDYNPGATIKVGVAAIVDEPAPVAGRDTSRRDSSGRDGYGRDGYGNSNPARSADASGAANYPDRSYGRGSQQPEQTRGQF